MHRSVCGSCILARWGPGAPSCPVARGSSAARTQEQQRTHSAEHESTGAGGETAWHGGWCRRARGPPPTPCVTVRVSPSPYAGCTPTPRYPSICFGSVRPDLSNGVAWCPVCPHGRRGRPQADPASIFSLSKTGQIYILVIFDQFGSLKTCRRDPH